MSWLGRKISMSDDVDQKQVIKEYFKQKNQKYLNGVQSTMDPKDLNEFWAEYIEDQDNG